MNYISFFSGAGGLDLGLDQAGWNPVYQSDYDADCVETLTANSDGRAVVRREDIRDVDPEVLLRQLNVAAGEIDAVVGGPPCQAFSTAGRRGSLGDPRGSVSLWYLEHIRVIQPRFVILENVRGLLSAPLEHVPHDAREAGWEPEDVNEPGGALRLLLHVLEDELRYSVSFALYDAANFGVPQRRERVIIIANRDGNVLPLLTPTHQQTEEMMTDWVTVQEAWAGREGLSKSHSYEFKNSQLEYMTQIPPGGNWRSLPKAVQQVAMGKSYFSGGGKTGFYRRLAWDAPSPTLVTSPRMPATLLGHPSENRTISVAEASALQQFPPDWQFPVDPVKAFRQIGNAVPVGLGAAIGQHINAFERGAETGDPIEAGLTLSRYKLTTHETFRRSLDANGRQTALFLPERDVPGRIDPADDRCAV